MTKMMPVLLMWLAFASHGARATTLDIYFIDVEGGQATLIVTPARETLLIDAGWPGEGTFQSKAGPASTARDAQRIVAATRDAGVTKIDYLLITHFHRDHFGGVSELAQLLPIGTFVDYGNPVPQDDLTGNVDPLDAYALETYAKVRAQARHMKPKPGDHLPLQGVQTIVVSSDRSTLAAPLSGAGARNESCGASAIESNDSGENPRSIGVLLQHGKFRFLDLGDLSGRPLFDLVCPTDRIGPVDVYLVAHHGARDAANPATFAAFKPRVSIINNGARKGGTSEIIAAVRQTGGVSEVWQLHRLEAAAAENVAEERIANLDEHTAHWIRISAKADGSFRVLNGRTGIWKDYPAR